MYNLGVRMKITFKPQHILFLLLLEVMGASAAFSDDELPSTVTMYSKGDSNEVLGNGRTIWLRKSESEDYIEIPLPASLYQENLDISFSVLELSRDGKYIFIAMNGYDGLSRYDVEAELWSTARPLEASRSVSALAKSPKGDIYIGCGGYLFNNGGNGTGIFRSTDNGETWSEIDVKMDARQLPGVTGLSINDDETLAFIARQLPGTSPAGLYAQSRTGVWNGPFPIVREIVPCDSGFIAHNGKNVFRLLQRDSTVEFLPVMTRPIVYNIASVTSSLVLIASQKDEPGILRCELLGKNLVVVDSIMHQQQKRDNDLKCFPRVGSTSSVYIFSRGMYSMSWKTGVADTVRLGKARPLVQHMYSAGSTAWIRISQHGWYEWSGEHSFRPSSLEESAVLDSVTKGATVQYDRGSLLIGNGYLVSLDKDGPRKHTVLGRASGTIVDAMVARTPESAVIATSDSLFTATETDADWISVSYSARPGRISSGDTTMYDLQALLESNQNLCAWFNGPRDANSNEPSSGMYQVVDERWEHIPFPSTVDNPALIQAVGTSTSSLLYIRDNTASPTTGVNTLWLLKDGVLRLVEPQSSIIPYVSTVFAGSNMYGHTNGHGQLHLWSRGGQHIPYELGTNVLESVVIEQGVLLATRDKGMVLIPTVDTVVSVIAGHSGRESVKVYCSDHDEWQIRGLGCGESNHLAYVYDVLGQSVSVQIVSSSDSLRVTLAGGVATMTPLLSVFISETGRCKHTAILVR